MAKKSRTAKKRLKVEAGAPFTETLAKPSEKEEEERPEPRLRKAIVRTGPALSERLVERPRSWWLQTAQFLREVRMELKKVTWPSRRETLASTSVVIVLVIIAAVFLGLVDLGLSRLIRAVIG